MTPPSLKRLAAVGVVAAGAISLIVGPVSADPTPATSAAKTVPVRLLSINDLHGNLEPPSGSSGRITDETGTLVNEAGGVAYLATYIKQLKNKNTMLVAAGDLIGASPLISAAYHDEPTIQIIDKLGLKTSSVGNHEFDEGYAELKRITNGGCHPTDGCSPEGTWKGSSFDFLGANVLKESGKYALPPYFIKQINGVNVGFIGLVTATTPTIVTAEGIKGLQFTEEVAAANKVSKFLARHGVKAQVVLMHEGDQVTPNQSPDACSVVPDLGSRIASGLDAQIDLVISGHSHQAYVCKTKDPAGQDRYYTQGSSFGRVLTQIDFQVDGRTRDVVRSTVTVDNHIVRRTVTPDAEIAGLVQTWKTRVATVANKAIGSITSDISNLVINTSPATTEAETPLGDLIADAQLEATKTGGNAEIALMNPGGIRAPLNYTQSGTEGDGVVTYGEAFTVQPFNNLMQVVTLTGAQLDALLEQQIWTVAANGTVTHRILQPSSSLTYTFDTTQAVGSRVSNIKINGVAVTDAQSIRVAANNFLVGGGDGFSVFTQGTALWSGPLDIDAFVTYVGGHSPIAPPATGRITFVK